MAKENRARRPTSLGSSAGNSIGSGERRRSERQRPLAWAGGVAGRLARQVGGWRGGAKTLSGLVWSCVWLSLVDGLRCERGSGEWVAWCKDQKRPDKIVSCVVPLAFLVESVWSRVGSLTCAAHPARRRSRFGASHPLSCSLG